jgi:hypothetical protein
VPFPVVDDDCVTTPFSSMETEPDAELDELPVVLDEDEDDDTEIDADWPETDTTTAGRVTAAGRTATRGTLIVAGRVTVDLLLVDDHVDAASEAVGTTTIATIAAPMTLPFVTSRDRLMLLRCIRTPHSWRIPHTASTGKRDSPIVRQADLRRYGRLAEGFMKIQSCFHVASPPARVSQARVGFAATCSPCKMGPMTNTSELIEISDGETVWRIDRSFMTSNWTCIWGNGCHGIETERASALAFGCCSVGAQLDGVEEENMVAASAAALTPEGFQFHAEASVGGIFVRAEHANTRVVEGACIFLNRVGFPGGAGCALHLAATAVDESPIDWKPSVCWQLPVKVDWEQGADGSEVATVRAWQRNDWGDDGQTMAWCCTERSGDHSGQGTDEAYVGTERVVDSLREELQEILGEPVYIELRRRLAGDRLA